MTGEQQRTCRACDHQVVEGARWCGHCGERLTDPAPVPAIADARTESSSSPPPSDPATPGPPRPDHAADEDEAPTRESTARRRPPVAVVVAVALAAVAAVVLVARPDPLPLHEAAALHPARAGVLDAARTGTVDADLGSRGGPRWADPAHGQDQWVWPQVADEVVVVHSDHGATVLDRRTGEHLWESGSRGGSDVSVAGGVLLRHEDDAIHGLDPRDGTVRWTVEDLGYPHWRLVDDLLLFVRDSTEDQLTGVDPETGEVVWVVELGDAGDGHLEVQDSHAGRLVASRFAFGEMGRTNVGLLLVDPVAGTSRELALEESMMDGVGWAQVSLLDGDRALVLTSFDDGTSRGALLDLDSGAFSDLPDRLGQITYATAAGPFVAVGSDEASQLLDRDLQPTGITAEGYLDVDPESLSGPLPAYRVHGHDGVTTVHALEDGRVLHVDDHRDRGVNENYQIVAEGVVTASALRVSWEPFVPGEEGWVRELGEERVHEVAAFGDRIVDIEEDGLRIRGADGQIVQRHGLVASPVGAPRWHPRERVAVNDRFLALTTDDGVEFVGENGVEVWRASLPGARSVAASKDLVWVATADELVALDATTGEVARRVDATAPWAISAAGERLLVVTSGEPCPDGQATGCGLRYAAHTPSTLEPRWQAPAIDGGCGAPTLAGRHVAVPVHGGVVFLEASSGKQADHWDLDGAGCPYLGARGETFIAVVEDSLHHGEVGARPQVVDLRQRAIAEPLVTPTGVVLVPLATGLEVLDGSWEVLRFRGVPNELSGRPAVTDGGDLVVPRRDGGTTVYKGS